MQATLPRMQKGRMHFYHSKTHPLVSDYTICVTGTVYHIFVALSIKTCKKENQEGAFAKVPPKKRFFISSNIPQSRCERSRRRSRYRRLCRFEYRPQVAKVGSSYPDGDVGRNKGETPLVVSPSSF